MSRLIDFYEGSGADHRGRTIDEILAWDDQRLESTHDYIQWLFPLAEPSRFNPAAPLLNETDRAEFARRPELRAKMLAALRRMAAFYGFSLLASPDEPNQIQFTAQAGQPRHWLTPGNHNFLRITRILTSLRLVGLSSGAREFFATLSGLYENQSTVIGAETFGYWQRALGN